jgi:hypothetical protein
MPTDTLQLEFIPVQEFYFALTLAVRTLDEFGDPVLVEQFQSQLIRQFGQASTVAAGQQNNFNYVFRVLNYDNSPAQSLIVSVADWQGKVRLGSDYGWVLDDQRKAVRTEKFGHLAEFSQRLKNHLQESLGLSFGESTSLNDQALADLAED